MKAIPNKIDGANVLEWAYSGDLPFGVIKYEDGEIAETIFGLVICQYDNSKTVYRFSCDKNWETKQDSDYSSIKELKNNIPIQYQNVPIIWNIKN